MTQDDRRQVQDLFEICIQLNPSRHHEVFRTSDVSAEIRDEVERLLRNHRTGTEPRFRPRELVHEIPALFSPGDRVGSRFTVVEFIERGGMGEVYRARTPSGETVALKVIRPLHGVTEEGIRRFRREFQSQAQVHHPNVCRVFESFQHETRQETPQETPQETQADTIDCFTMQFLEGRSLATVLRDAAPLAEPDIAVISSGILAGLAAAHACGIVHRDLKPSNIMLVEDGRRAVLLDFGLARISGANRPETSFTKTGQAFGTLDYMSPEQLRGARADARSDLYAFGLILFEMLTGTHPFRGAHSEPGLHRPDGGMPKLPRDSGFEVRWSEAINACLEPDPADRAGSAEMVRALIEGRARGPWIRMPRRIRRRAAIGLCAAAVAGAGIYYREREKLRVARGTVVLIPDSIASDALTAKAVTIQFRNLLKRSEYVTVWDEGGLADVWSRMGRAAPSAPSERDWREIAFRERLGLVAFLAVAGRYLEVRVQEVHGSPERAWRQWTRRFGWETDDQVLGALDSAGRWLRELAGESANEIADSAPVEAATTPSWPALKEYSRGEDLANQRHLEDALFAYSAALRLDSDFTMAWMRTGDINMSLAREKEAFLAWKRAVDSASRRPLSRREDLRFRSMLASDAGDYEAAEKLFAEYYHYFPAEWFGLFYRELPLMMLGRVEEALIALKKTLQFPDRRGRAHVKLCWALLYKGDVEGAREHAAEVERMKLTAMAGWANAAIDYVEGNADGALDALRRAANDAQLIPTTIHAVYRCNVLADAGRTEEAIRFSFESAAEDLRLGRPAERAAKIIGGAALLAQSGDRAECVRRLAAIDVTSLGPRRLTELVMLLARNQALDSARKAAAYLRIDLPYPRFRIARLRADGEIAMASGQVREGLKLLAEAAGLDVRAYGKYYLADALERSGDAAAARSEYQQHLRSKPFQIHVLTPEPAGSWRRSLVALRRLT